MALSAESITERGSQMLREATMLAKGMNRILLSGGWLTSQEVAELAQFNTVNASSQPNKWKRAGRFSHCAMRGQTTT